MVKAGFVLVRGSLKHFGKEVRFCGQTKFLQLRKNKGNFKIRCCARPVCQNISERRVQLHKHKTDKTNENNIKRKLKEKTRIKDIERKAPKSF